MNKLNTSPPELLNMLKIVESYFKGEKAPVLPVDKINKKKGKKGYKKKMNPKTGISKKKKSKEGLRYRYLLSLWQGGLLEEKLQEIPCNSETGKCC